MEIDEKDKKIINVLLENAKLSFREVAKKVGVSVVTVLKRARMLERAGVIKGYTAELDYEQLGYDVNAIIRIRIAKGKLFEVEKKIATDPHIFAVYDVTGDVDCVIIAKFRSRRDLDRFLKKIQTYDFVCQTGHGTRY